MDQAFEKAQAGSHDGFAAWVRLCEAPLRRGLRSFAASVDVEAIVQEGLLRMWVLAPRLELAGDNASLRYAHRLVSRLALSEVRRLRRVEPTDPAALENSPDVAVQPEPAVAARLRTAIRDCLKRLPRRPRLALMARLGVTSTGRASVAAEGNDNSPPSSPHPIAPDKELATRLDMQLNTFLQNIVRARRFLARCLEGHGVNVEEFL